MRFKKIMLPVIALAVLAAGVLAYLQYEKQKHLSSPAFALETLTTAIAQHNVTAFEAHLDTHKFSLSILQNMLQDPKATDISDEAEESSDDSLGDIGSKLVAKLGRRVASFVQPELSKNLQAQMLSYVKNGSFGDDLDLSRLYGGSTPMLESLWNELKGEGISFGAPRILQSSDVNASAFIPYTRDDIDYQGEISLVLEKSEQGIWLVTGVSNLATELLNIKERHQAVLKEQNTLIEEQIKETLHVVTLEKSAGVSQWGVGKGLMIRAGFENMSDKTISAFHATLLFKDETGEVIKQTSISDTDTLLPSTVLEKSWPMGLNPLSQVDKYIYAAEDNSLTIDVSIESILFENGDALKILELE